MFSRRLVSNAFNFASKKSFKNRSIHFNKVTSEVTSASTKSRYPKKFFVALALAAATGSLLHLYKEGILKQQELKEEVGKVLTGGNFCHVYADDSSEIQDTVISGMHPNCAVVTIHLKPEAKGKLVATRVKNIERIVKRLNSENLSDKKENPSGDEEEDEEDKLLPVLAGVGFSLPFWKQLTGADYGEYHARNGMYGEMPATGGDLILHIKAASRSLCYEAVEEFLKQLPPGSVARVEDNYGFQYKDGRDLSGFLDGTMNVVGNDERRDAAVRADTGGSFLIHQIWHHNIDQFHSRSLKEQEDVIGRSKDYSIEMKKLPVQSHVARMRRDGNQERILIVRQSMPFGNVAGPRGLLFIGYSNSIEKFDKMLDRMTGKEKDGKNDAIMTFSKCRTGNYWYFPSKKELEGKFEKY